MATETRMPFARKEYRCAFTAHNILPGERYVDDIYTPWTLELNDVDDDGRPIGSPLGRWLHVRYHAKCMPYGYTP